MAAEHLLRAVSIGALAWMLWLSFGQGVVATDASATSGRLANALPDWTRSGVIPRRITVRLDSAPTPRQRDWLGALRGAGSIVDWSGPVAASAISVQPVASPNGGKIVMVAAPDSATVALGDELGPIDTLRAAGAGASFAVPAATGVLTARVGGTANQAAVSDSITIKRLLVIGSAGWESKFVVAALEENGWTVDADIRIAPGVSVSEGSTAAIDTSRYAAVLVLDEAGANRAARIATYVESGGGLILAGRASQVDAFAEIRPGTLSSRSDGNPGDGSALAASTRPTTLRTLSFFPVVRIRPDAVPLGRLGPVIAAAARRHGAGRVLQHGYAETWRWRMSGGQDALREHRRWWTTAVASVAYAPRTTLPLVEGTDPAPLAALTAALGPAAIPSIPDVGSGTRPISRWWLFALLSTSLILEWSSRRLRGAK